MFLLRQRQLKTVTSFALGCWLFAFIVAVVQACTLDGVLVGAQHDAHQVATGAADHHEEDGVRPPGCEQFCADEARQAARSTPAQDPPGEQALLHAPLLNAAIAIGVTPVALLIDRPHPPSGIALYTRFLRLAL